MADTFIEMNIFSVKSELKLALLSKYVYEKLHDLIISSLLSVYLHRTAKNKGKDK